MIYNSWDNFLIKRTVFKVQKYNNIKLIPLIGTKLLKVTLEFIVSLDSFKAHRAACAEPAEVSRDALILFIKNQLNQAKKIVRLFHFTNNGN